MDKPLNVTQCATATGFNRETIAIALRNGALHGVQDAPGKSRWRVRESCLEAWVDGVACQHRAVLAVAA